jgi:hypothetical protein
MAKQMISKTLTRMKRILKDGVMKRKTMKKMKMRI